MVGAIDIPSLVSRADVVVAIQVVMTLLFLVAAGAVYILHGMACPDPSAHPKTQKTVLAGEECKLHSRKLADCTARGWHDTTNERPGWETCGQRGCLIVPPHDHVKKEDE